ncbi:LOW QUALITY PROTEIN: hypothetical protein PHMEG_00030406 [Phytophthora megakarya]|uniref:Uncharacterized protein n=1 Tax=Phytophthora megakarya TaxID=4795 RepID=A0A225V0M3_9STRA|nr:LOW QUALITY PROTEIN: hypothetical protein PHMEG_00030406 [Phytophthora megakarya]
MSKVHFEESLDQEKQPMQRAFDDQLAQQTQSADVGQKNWLTNAQNALEERERMLNSQWSNFELQLKKREEEWKLEKETMANGMQNLMLTVLQAALSKVAPHPATGIQSESLSPPDSATLNPNSQTPIVGASPIVAPVEYCGGPKIKRETPSVKSATRREPSNASQTSSSGKRAASQVARKTSVRKEESISSSSKKSQSKKAKEQSDPHPDDPDDSEPSDSDNDAS